jgi:large subunit ribosomal protein L3
MKFIIGTKNGMTQVFREDGNVVPVTRVKAGPCTVTQVKTETKDGVNSIQVGFSEQKKFRLNKAQQGHLKDLPTLKILKEFKSGQELKRGDKFTVNVFEAGDKIQVTGWSKGKGFQGVVKRHGFSGSPASHGHKDQLRMPGSIGATDAARVFKGTRMAGHMGNDRVTVKNLEIVEVKTEENELLIKGAVPGAKGGLLLISSGTGDIKIEEVNPSTDAQGKEEKKVEEKAEETKIEEKAEEKAEESKTEEVQEKK